MVLCFFQSLWWTNLQRLHRSSCLKTTGLPVWSFQADYKKSFLTILSKTGTMKR
jgi:hypothetical protein